MEMIQAPSPAGEGEGYRVAARQMASGPFEITVVDYYDNELEVVYEPTDDRAHRAMCDLALDWGVITQRRDAE